MTNWYYNERSKLSQGTVIEEGTGRTVAVVYDPKDTPLASAAPDLLAACRAMLALFDVTGEYCPMASRSPFDKPEALRAARAAIAKATA